MKDSMKKDARVCLIPDYRDCNLNCVSKEKNIIFTNTVFL